MIFSPLVISFYENSLEMNIITLADKYGELTCLFMSLSPSNKWFFSMKILNISMF